jgi:hypothetical protein
MWRSGLVAIIILAALPSADRFGSGPGRPDKPIVLWAWERREDLRFIDPTRVGVAFLAGTVRLSGDAVEVRPRLPAIMVPQATTLLPVVRIETGRPARPTLSAAQRSQAVEAIATLAGPPMARRIQIDFDATRSERAFYSALLADLRRRLPREARLSITALASWCLGDDWIAALPIDEAVPMLFRMGSDDAVVRHLLAARADFRPPLCRQSVGVALDEPLPCSLRGRPTYVFAPHPWSPASYQAALALVEGDAP